MDSLPFQLVAIGLLIAVNGVLAGSEIALVSLRPGQVARLAGGGPTSRLVARLARDPNRYLVTVQIGITLAGFLASAVAATTLADSLSEELGALGGADTAVAVLVVTLLLTYFNLTFGEIVPKRIAMQRAQAWALAAARPLALLAALTAPAVWVLSRTTDLSVRLLGADPTRHGTEVTEEELRAAVMSRRGMSALQRRIVAGALEAGRRTVADAMVPRRDVLALREDSASAEALRELAGAGHTRAPVFRESLDDASGIVHLRDLVLAEGTVRDARRAALALPLSLPVLAALSALQRERESLAVVVDEHGGTAGIVTVEDLLEELVGEIYDEFDPPHVLSGHDEDGVLWLAGRYPIHDLAELGIAAPAGRYRTVAGLILDRLGRMPEVGDAIRVGDRVLRVAEVENRAIRRVRVESEAASES